MGTVNLHIDCSRMEPSATQELFERLELISPAIIVGDDLILVQGLISWRNYNRVWCVLDCYDVDVD